MRASFFSRTAVFLFLLIGFFSFAATAHAAGSLFVPAECTGDAGVAACGLSSVIKVFYGISNFIFGISGSLALFFFIYGGFKWLTSAGSAEGIKEGQTIVRNAVIGLVIIFGAQAMVAFVRTAVGGGASGAAQNVAPVAGASCKDDKNPLPSDKTIQPHFVDWKGKLECVSSCDALASITGTKFRCTGSAAKDAICEPGLCGGGDKCCWSEQYTDNKECECTFEGDVKTTMLVPAGAACPVGQCKYDILDASCHCGSILYSFLVSDPETKTNALGQSESDFAASCEARACSGKTIFSQ